MISICFYSSDYSFKIIQCGKNDSIEQFLLQAGCQQKNAYLKGCKMCKEDPLDKYIESFQYNAIYVSFTRNQKFKFQPLLTNLDNYQFVKTINNRYSYIFLDLVTQKDVYLCCFDDKFDDVINHIYFSYYLRDFSRIVKIIDYRFFLNPNEKIISELNKTFSTNVYISEYLKNGTVSNYNNFYFSPKRAPNSNMNPTIRSKIIFGVACIMRQLHDIGIIHNNLTVKNVFLDENFEPKIGGFNYSVFIGKFKSNNSGDLITVAPETVDGFTSTDLVTESVDVYAFAFFLFQMFTTQTIDRNIKIPLKYLNMVINGHRPNKIDGIPDHYWELIEKCWSQNSCERPSFHEIVDILKDDKYALEEFDMKTDLDELHEYQNRIENETRIKIKEEDEDDEEYLDLSKYSKINKIGENSLGKIFKVKLVETGQVYSAIVSKIVFSENDLKNSNIYKEAKILSKLNHPCIPKYIGFSPVDFKNKNKPLILIEFTTNNTLKQLFETERKITHIDQWDYTKKFIHVYSLASCMSYLDSMDIVFKNLSSENVIVDDFLCPKLIDFTCSNFPKTLIRNIKEEELQVSPKYFSPELIKYGSFSKSSDVYAFSLILYEIVSGSKLFEGKTSFQIMNDILEGNRPQFNSKFDDKNDFYKSLIDNCWSEKSSERQSFEGIVGVLINNLKSIDAHRQKDVNTYIDYIEQSQSFYEKDQQIIQIDDFIDNDNKTFKKVDLKEIQSEYLKKKRIELNCNYININDYYKDNKIGEGNFGVVYKIINKNTNDPFAAKISKNELNDIDEDELISHYREVSIISKLNHPCILKFIGYSPTNFNNVEKPVIVTDLTQKGTLNNVINLERNSMALSEWDKTTKLINIYGIASSMSYLHRCNIIHRDLKPANILLDENLYPRLADFGLSKEITENNKNVPNQYDFKGTPLYSSPEILKDYNYTKAGDVYAFGLIVYEIMTAEIPFKSAKMFYNILSEVVIQKKRPTFTYPIPNCYKELIEECWQHDYSKRPTFDEIVEKLRNNPDFVEDVDVDAYFDYIYSIDGIEKQYQNQEEDANYLKNVLYKIELNSYKEESIVENHNDNKIDELESDKLYENFKEETLKLPGEEEVQRDDLQDNKGKKYESDGKGGCCNIV